MGNVYLIDSAPRLSKRGGGNTPSCALLLALLSWLGWLAGPAACAQALGPGNYIECYTLPPGAPAQSLTGTGSAAAPGVVSNSSCAQFPEYAPGIRPELGLPEIPIKTVRIMFHVFQDDYGKGNWQAPNQDGGADEALLRGLVYGLTQWPLNTTPQTPQALRTLRGLNGVYSQLDQRLMSTATNRTAVPAPAALADTRIRFQLEGIRYYRNSTYWNLSDNNPWGCGSSTDPGVNNDNCRKGFYTTFITNSATNRDVAGTALTAAQKTDILHIFFGENPGIASTRTNELGHMSTRFSIGGVASGIPGAYAYCRGLYWGVKQHPSWSLGIDGFRYAEFILAHELGHCLGLAHVNGEDSCTGPPFTDPPVSTGTVLSNNVMDPPGANAGIPGFSLSQCQIGKMHYYLGHAGVGLQLLQIESGSPIISYLDNMLVPDYCQHMSGEDVTIKAGQSVVWSSAQNLRGNLYIEAGASLTVRCRVGFVGPEAKIVVREGGELVLDNGTIGNYATSDQLECPNDLRLWLGGDGSDGDNSGLITIRNGGGFTSPRLKAVLAERATLHIGPASVLLDGCHLTTQANSFLCVEPGATFSYARQAQLTIEPGTVLGVNPAIRGIASCEQDLCALLGKEVAFSASTVNAQGAVTPQCRGRSITMAARLNTAGGSVTWFRDGTLVASSETYTETPTGPGPIVYQAQVDFNNGCPPLTWSFTQTISPAATIQLLSSVVSVCAEGTGTNYFSNGRFNLNSLIGSIRDPNDAANQNTSFSWVDPTPTGTSPLIGMSSGMALLNVATLRGRGLTSYRLQLCNTSTNPAVPCTACATVRINLDAGPAFTVPTPAAACLGTAVTLTASGPAGTTYQWQPGNLTGASVTVTPATNALYTVTGTAPGGCQATRQVPVTVVRPTCLACLGTNYTDMSQIGTSFSSLNFRPGKTYMFNQNTEFVTGSFVLPEGVRLLFGPNVTLTLRNGGQLDLQGGTLTAACDQMWGGIVAEASSRGVISQKPASLPYTEISHSRNGLMINSNAGPNTAQPTLRLNYVAFLHNGQGVQVANQGTAGYAFAGVVDHCRFDSDPRQMLAPWQYVSAQDLHVSLRHLALAGNCAGLTVQNTTLDHALFGVWVPNTAPFTATNSVFQNIYVAGVYARDALTPATHLTLNQFIYPPANNEIISSHSPQMRDVFATDLAAEGPNSLLREGVCVGVFGPTPDGTFTLAANTFAQNQPLTSFNTRVTYPQYGGIITGGVVRENIFRNLQIGYMSASTQSGGQVQNNLFENCIYGAYFTNSQLPTGTVTGTATVSCNTFVRQPGISGTSYGIVRDYCQALGQGGPCDQIDFMTVPGTGGPGAPLAYKLQKNKFEGPSSSGNPFYHVYNAPTNAQITYSTFDVIASTIVVNSPTLVFVDNSRITLTATTPSALGNDCASEGYQYGLQGRSTGPSTPNGSAASVPKDIFLAQNAPNPCVGTTSVSYRTPEGRGEVQLVIRDYFSGAVVQRQVVPAGAHTVEVNVGKLRAGGYHYALELDGLPVAHHNLLVQ